MESNTWPSDVIPQVLAIAVLSLIPLFDSKYRNVLKYWDT